MKKLVQGLKNSFGMLRVQRSRGNGVDLSVARVAERNQVGKIVVPVFAIITEAAPVDMVNVRRGFVSALSTSEVVPAQRIGMALVSVLGGELRPVAAPWGAVEHIGAGARDHRPANFTRKAGLTRFAAFGSIVAWAVGFTASVAYLVVGFGTRVAEAGAAALTALLLVVKDRNGRSAVDTVFDGARFSHARQNLLIGVL